METEAKNAATESIRGWRGVEIVGELFRETVLTCLWALMRPYTHNRSMYLNQTQATSYVVLNRILVGWFAKRHQSDTSQVRFYPTFKSLNIDRRQLCAGGGGAWQYPSMHAQQIMEGLVIEKRVKSVLLWSLFSLFFSNFLHSDCTTVQNVAVWM